MAKPALAGEVWGESVQEQGLAGWEGERQKEGEGLSPFSSKLKLQLDS